MTWDELFPDAAVHLIRCERKRRAMVSKAKIRRMIDAVGKPASKITMAPDGSVEIGFEDDTMARTGDDEIIL